MGFCLFLSIAFNPITLKILRACEFDKDAKLLNPFYTNRILSRGFQMEE